MITKEMLVQQNEYLKNEVEILREATAYYELWRCPKCEHYSMTGFICHWCGYDRWEENE